MAKKFWPGGPVSKMLKKPRQALRKTFRAVRGRGPELDQLLAALPQSLASLERGTRVLDQGFPIREGFSKIDLLTLNPSGELTFVWVRPLCRVETLSKLLPDYDWIQKNRSLWPHLFPQMLESRSLQMRVWLFALEIDPEVRYLLNYLQGIRIRLFLARKGPEGKGWTFKTWEEIERTLDTSVPLPSSPSRLSVVPEPEPTTPRRPAPEMPLLSQEELQDLLHLTPGEESFRQEDEITDPFARLGPGPDPISD